MKHFYISKLPLELRSKLYDSGEGATMKMSDDMAHALFRNKDGTFNSEAYNAALATKE